MVTYQGCPQTPGGRIRALGFARMGARGRRRGPIPAVCHCYSSPVSYHRAVIVTHQGCPQTPGGRIRAPHHDSRRRPTQSSVTLAVTPRVSLGC
jgi:hypothetical protein